MGIINEIADNMAEDLFDSGEDQGTVPHRIAFMGGEYGGDEYQMGGLNKQAFASFVESALIKYFITN